MGNITTNHRPLEPVLYGLLTEKQQRKVNYVLMNRTLEQIIDGEYIFYNGHPYKMNECIQMTTNLFEDPEGYWVGFFIAKSSITLVHDNDNGSYVFGTMTS